MLTVVTVSQDSGAVVTVFQAIGAVFTELKVSSAHCYYSITG